MVEQDDVDAYWKLEDFCGKPPRADAEGFKPCVGMVLFAKHRIAAEGRGMAEIERLREALVSAKEALSCSVPVSRELPDSVDFHKNALLKVTAALNGGQHE
jgi:hypothetical protein